MFFLETIKNKNEIFEVSNVLNLWRKSMNIDMMTVRDLW